MSTVFLYKFYTKAQRDRAARTSYAPYIAEQMKLGSNVRKAIASLKPGQAIDLRYRSLTDRVIFDHPKHDNVKIVRRFRMNDK